MIEILQAGVPTGGRTLVAVSLFTLLRFLFLGIAQRALTSTAEGACTSIWRHVYLTLVDISV